MCKWQIEGDIVAHNDISEWENCEDNTWIYFAYIDNLFVQGQGSIDGRGSIWWKNAPLLTNRDTHATINVCIYLHILRTNNMYNFFFNLDKETSYINVDTVRINILFIYPRRRQTRATVPR